MNGNNPAIAPKASFNQSVEFRTQPNIQDRAASQMFELIMTFSPNGFSFLISIIYGKYGGDHFDF